MVDPEDLDLLRYERLLAAADASTDPVAEATALARALKLWRGPVVADIDSPAIRAYDVPAITDRRLIALGRRIELDVWLGRDAMLLPELRALVAENPWHERFWKWLMVVLDRQGRRADALDVYRRLAHRLVAELGIEPGPELREVHRRILRGVEPVPAPSTVASVRIGRPRPYPPAHTTAAGRTGSPR